MPLRAAKVRSDLEYFEQEVDDEQLVIVRDPIRGTYFRFNVLQAGMLRALDGVRTPVEIAAELSEEFEVEVPATAAERFVTRARELLLLDVASYRTASPRARKLVARELRKARFRLRGELDDEGDTQRVASAESALFMAAVRQLRLNEPLKAADYLVAVLELNPDNRRAKELHALIQRAFVRGSGGATTEHPTFVLFNPSRMLNVLRRTIGPFLFSPWGVLAMAVYVWIGVQCFSRISFANLDIGARDVIVLLVETRISLFLHEMGHGLACQYYGGNVTEIGVMMMYYVSPAAYCDTSSTYLFQNRRHKVIVQLAGVTSSVLYIATGAMVVSVMNPELAVYDGLRLALLVETTFAFLTLVPFIKNDGYFAIGDYLELRNLRDRSFRLASVWLQRNILGLPVDEEKLSPGMRRWFLVYAVAAFACTGAFIYWSLFRLLAPLVEWAGGWGLVVAVAFTLFVLSKYVFRPVASTARLVWRERRAIFTRRRTGVVVALAALIVLPWAIRWPVLIDSEFVLAPVQRVHVRAQTPGIVERVLVREGQSVERGQPIAQLRNDALTARRRALEEDLAIAEAGVALVKSGPRSEEVDLARYRAARAATSYGQSASQAARVRAMARDRVTPVAAADKATGAARVAGALAGAAAARLALVRAGALPEEIAAREAERSGLQAQLQQLRLDEERLTLRSPYSSFDSTRSG